ncbi:MAG: lysyl endopeptidase, partial [bacterium]
MRIAVLLGLAIGLAAPVPAVADSAIFGGGPFYAGGTATMNTLRASGYTTVNLWTLHVYADAGGSLIYNDQLVVANGAYAGNAGWPAQLATLKTAPTSVKRIEWSVGSWGASDFQALKILMDTHGTNTESLVYRNFLALKNATGADAIQFDDESQYDVATAVKFGRMLSAMGYKVTLCP